MKKLLSLLIISFLFLGNINISFWENVCTYQEINNSLGLVYSPNGLEYAYVNKKNNKEVVIKNWIESKEYDSVYALGYSPDSKSFAFIA